MKLPLITLIRKNLIGKKITNIDSKIIYNDGRNHSGAVIKQVDFGIGGADYVLTLDKDGYEYYLDVCSDLVVEFEINQEAANICLGTSVHELLEALEECVKELATHEMISEIIRKEKMPHSKPLEPSEAMNKATNVLKKFYLSINELNETPKN